MINDGLLCCLYVLFLILVYIDHVVMGFNYATLTFAINLWTCYPLLKAKCSQTSVSYLSLMNPWLYLLSTICAHSCNFPTPQDMIMKMTGMRITVMSTRFGVNQSTVSLCGASVESVVYFMLSFLYETMWYFIFRYVINTAMVHLRFVYLCVRLFLGHIWVFYASYFVLKIWVWQIGIKALLTVGRKPS